MPALYYPRLRYTYRKCLNLLLFHLCFFKIVTFPFPKFFCHLCLSYCVESMTRTNLLHINKADNWPSVKLRSLLLQTPYQHCYTNPLSMFFSKGDHDFHMTPISGHCIYSDCRLNSRARTHKCQAFDEQIKLQF